MGDEEGDRQVVHGWSFPGDLDVPGGLGEAWHQFKIGGNTIKGLSSARHVDLAHQRGAETIDVEIVHTGFADGILHVGAKAVVEIGGNRYTSVQGADSASNQVNEPGYTYAVAETRALKRAVKKALNIYPVDESTAEFEEEEVSARGSDHGGSVEVDEETGEVDVRPPPDRTPDVEVEGDAKW